jgi:hypothetical protein
MNNPLPVAIQLYLGSRVKDHLLLIHCFTEDALVIEDGRLYKGVKSIVAWHGHLENNSPRLGTTDLEFVRTGDQVKVKVMVCSEPPSRPIRRLYRFEMRDHRIALLEIV